MKNVVAYLRVSTDGQIGEDKYGLDVQRSDIETFALKNEYNICDWFIEEGVSGGKLDRPELNRLLNGDITNPPVEAVIVAKTDRLSRDIQMYYFIKLSLKKRGFELISVQEDWGSYGMMAPMLEAMVVAFAEFERQMITTRTSNGRKAKAAKGGYSGGKPPYGYNVIDSNLVINEDEGEVVKLILNSESTLRELAEHLNFNNIKTKSGAKWYAAQIGYVRKNRKLYEGFYKYGNEEWVTGTHKAII